MPRTLSPSVVLTFTGGYVDAAGFITLHGLFVAHVTGNLVVAGSAFFRGTLAVTSGLLALPVFCAAVASTRIVSALQASNTGSGSEPYEPWLRLT